MNQPFRIRVVGDAHDVRFHAEQFALLPDVVVERVPCLDDAPHGALPPDALLVGGAYSERTRLVAESLALQRPVFCSGPIGVDATLVREIERRTAEAGIRVIPLYPRRGDGDFLRLRAELGRGSIGRVLSSRFLSLTFSPEALAECEDANGPGPAREHRRKLWLLESIGGIIDQAEWIHAGPAELGAVRWAMGGDAGLPVGLRIELLFPRGGTCLIDVGFLHAAPLQTGWWVEGTHGGIGGGRRWRLDDTGSTAFGPGAPPVELVEHPLAARPSDHETLYRTALDSVRNPGGAAFDEPFPSWNAESDRAALLERLLE